VPLDRCISARNNLSIPSTRRALKRQRRSEHHFGRHGSGCWASPIVPSPISAEQDIVPPEDKKKLRPEAIGRSLKGD
jgi:hypothetical protein